MLECLAVPSKKNSKQLKVWLWLFGVVFALLPIGANYVNGSLDHNAPGWIDLLAGGELFLISSAIAADAVFKALRGGDEFRGLRIFTGGCCLLVVAATSLYFGRIAYSDQERRAAIEAAIRANDLGLALRYVSSGMDRLVIAGHSFWLFVFAVISALCVIIIEED